MIQRFRDPKFLRFVKGLNCVCCGQSPCDPCHLRSKGAGGGDQRWNIVPMCRYHHSEQHAQGFYYMAKRYPLLMMVLVQKGWYFVDQKLVRDHE